MEDKLKEIENQITELRGRIVKLKSKAINFRMKIAEAKCKFNIGDRITNIHGDRGIVSSFSDINGSAEFGFRYRGLGNQGKLSKRQFLAHMKDEWILDETVEV